MPGPKPLRKQVVGLPGGGGLRQLAVVLLAELQVEHRDRQHEEDRDPEQHRRDRALADAARPPRPAVRAVVVRRRAQERHPQGVDPLAEDREQGGQQRDRGDHRDQDHDRRRVAERADDRDPRHRQRARARSPRCRRRTRPRRRRWPRRAPPPPRRVALLDEAAVAGDDEQRVVDPHAEPQHRPQRRAHGRHLDPVAEQADQRSARSPGRRSRWRSAAPSRSRCRT